MKKQPKVPAKVVERAKAVAVKPPPLKLLPAATKKAKVIAALKRLHPMD